MSTILGNNLKNIREAIGLSIGDFGDEFFNLSYHAIRKWENGVTKPTKANLEFISNLTGIDIVRLQNEELNNRELEVIKSFYQYNDSIVVLDYETVGKFSNDGAFVSQYHIYFKFSDERAVYNAFDLEGHIYWEINNNNLLIFKFSPYFNIDDKNFLKNEIKSIHDFIYGFGRKKFEELLYSWLVKVYPTFSELYKWYWKERFFDFKNIKDSKEKLEKALIDNPLKTPIIMIKNDEENPDFFLYYPIEFFVTKNIGLNISPSEVFKTYLSNKYNVQE